LILTERLAGDGLSAEPRKGFAVLHPNNREPKIPISGFGGKFGPQAASKSTPCGRVEPKGFNAKRAGPGNTPHCRTLSSTSRRRNRNETDLLEQTPTGLLTRAVHTLLRCHDWHARLSHLPAASCSSDWNPRTCRYGICHRRQNGLCRY
jgi:hypothetical protein